MEKDTGINLEEEQKLHAIEVLVKKKTSKLLDLGILLVETTILKEAEGLTTNLEKDPEVQQLRKDILMLDLQNKKRQLQKKTAPKSKNPFDQHGKETSPHCEPF